MEELSSKVPFILIKGGIKMASKITYEDKVALSDDPSVEEINKVSDENLNEIKTKFNQLVDELPSVIDNLTTASATDALSANQGKILYDKVVELEEKLVNLQATVTKLDTNLGDLTVEVVDEW